MQSNTILVVDDEPVMVELISQYLAYENVDIISAQNGMEALEKIEQEKPILVITDLRMPIMSGVELLEKLRVTANTPYAVIVITGFGSNDEIKKCYELGISSFLRKPFSYYELNGLVRNTIALKRSQNQLEELVKERVAEIVETNKKLIETEHELREALTEKEILLKEIHHRVKNNMQVISSLLTIQARYIDDENYVKVLHESRQRILSMALIHEKLYQSNDFSEVDFASYLDDLIKRLYQSYGLEADRIGIVLNMKSLNMSVDRAVPSGLVANEILTNTLKYAFPDNRQGKIMVDLDLSDGDLVELTIADDGVGIPEDYEFGSGKSLGSYLINSIVERQLMGTVELDRSNGTKFVLRFPRAT